MEQVSFPSVKTVQFKEKLQLHQLMSKEQLFQIFPKTKIWLSFSNAIRMKQTSSDNYSPKVSYFILSSINTWIETQDTIIIINNIKILVTADKCM